MDVEQMIWIIQEKGEDAIRKVCEEFKVKMWVQISFLKKVPEATLLIDLFFDLLICFLIGKVHFQTWIHRKTFKNKNSTEQHWPCFSHCGHFVWPKDEGVPWSHCALDRERGREDTAEVQSLGLQPLQRLTHSWKNMWPVWGNMWWIQHQR